MIQIKYWWGFNTCKHCLISLSKIVNVMTLHKIVYQITLPVQLQLFNVITQIITSTDLEKQ